MFGLLLAGKVASLPFVGAERKLPQIIKRADKELILRDGCV